MAISIGGASYFSEINSRLLQGPGAEDVRIAQSNSGATGAHARSALGKKATALTIELKDGVTLSLPAQAGNTKSDRDLEVERNAAEYAETTGLMQATHDDEGQIQERQHRNHESHVEAEARAGRMHRVTSPDGVLQQLTEDDALRLLEMDSQDHCLQHLNSDVPSASLRDANEVMESCSPQDLAELKFGPEAETAGLPELRPIGHLGAMETLGPPPGGMLMELGEETHEMAKNVAASLLASGQEIMTEIIFQ